MNDEKPMYHLMVLQNDTQGIFYGLYDELRKKPYTSLGRGYETVEELRREEGVITCHVCGQEAGTHYMEPVAQKLRVTKTCHTCDFWLEKIRWEEHPDGVHQPVRVDGKHYCYDPRHPLTSGDTRYNGFGGHRWTICFIDTARTVQVNDLWHQGTIPERFHTQLPDNADFL